MGYKLALKVEHFKWLAEKTNENRLTEHEIGELFKEVFPGIFTRGQTGKNLTTSIKRAALAAGFNMPKGMFHKIPVPHTAWYDETPELIFNHVPRLICLSDVHAPSHSVGAVELAARTIEEREITTCVWNGDLADNEYKGHKGIRDVMASSYEQCVSGVVGLIDTMTQAGITEHIFLQGNHDDKMFRGSDGEFTFTDFLDTKIFPEIDRSSCSTKATNRYYAIMKPRKAKAWPWTGPDNFPWVFTHQQNYGKNQLSVAMELASIELGNILSGHQHHLSVGKHKSGLMYLCDAGTLQDPRLARYKNARHSRHPKWDCGFITIEDGRPFRHDFGGI